MRRQLTALLAMVMAVMMVAGQAFAAPHEFSPNENAGQSCGLARPGAQEAIELQESPGATEYALVPPSSNCTGP
jgi:hypothetical protein